jgi:O-antigen ligase
MALLLAFIACLAIAGGASRSDVLGQAIVRLAAAIAIAGLILVGAKLEVSRWTVLLVAAAAALPFVQLIPLPPSIWSSLPGREVFLEAATIGGMQQPWRPIALSPDLTANALFSLLVPTAALMLTAALDATERAQIPVMTFALGLASSALAVVQLSGGNLDNPLINETVGTASGIFANPNHQALLLAISILAGACWAVGHRSTVSWRLPVAAGAAIWFLLMIMASGSRTGLVLGFLALTIATIIVRRQLGILMMRLPNRARLPIIAIGVASILSLAVVSFTAGRAVSLNRLLVLSTGEDMRSRALPTILEMIATYMPVGAGFGTFDPLFRLNEPDSLLKLTYFNHAHNDYLEVALEGGVFGVALIIAAIGWALRSGTAIWKIDLAVNTAPAGRFGAVVLLLVGLASVVDYPARTPTIMALLAIAAVLVGAADRGSRQGTLRSGTDRV